MTVQDALAKWSEGCTATLDGKGEIVRDGNWQPLARALRHDADATLAEAGKLNGDTVLAVKPAKKDPPAGKAPMVRPPYLLIVK